jgi:hypothetical protein
LLTWHPRASAKPRRWLKSTRRPPR